MSILIGIGLATIATTVGVIYVGKKGWQALHKAVGITPGVLVYQDPNSSTSLAAIRWRQLNLNKKHLRVLTLSHLRQLHDIDERVTIYTDYQQSLQAQNITPVLSEQQFVLHKLLHTRLPEILASHYQLVGISNSAAKQAEASAILQELLDTIEQRLESALTQMENHHLQDLRVMKNYMDSHG